MKYVIAFAVGFVVVGAWMKVHAAELVPPEWRNPMLCAQTDGVLSCEHYEREVHGGSWVLRPCTGLCGSTASIAPPTCAPGHEQACQQRDHGTDGLRRSEQR
jgi:hypothetical protein